MPLSAAQKRYVEEVRRIVLQALDPDAGKAYLFGSFAAGRARRGSDIDVAIWPSEKARGSLLSEIRERLEESTVPYKVDVVDLRSAAPEFREKVLREAVPWKG